MLRQGSGREQDLAEAEDGIVAAEFARRPTEKRPSENAFGDQMAVGAIPAVDKAGKKDQIKVFGVGASQKGIEEVRAGNLYGTVLNNSLPEEQGEQTAEMALQAARGEKIPNTGIVPKYPGIPPVLTEANQAEWKTWESGWEG